MHDDCTGSLGPREWVYRCSCVRCLLADHALHRDSLARGGRTNAGAFHRVVTAIDPQIHNALVITVGLISLDIRLQATDGLLEATPLLLRPATSESHRTTGHDDACRRNGPIAEAQARESAHVSGAADELEAIDP